MDRKSCFIVSHFNILSRQYAVKPPNICVGLSCNWQKVMKFLLEIFVID